MNRRAWMYSGVIGAIAAIAMSTSNTANGVLAQGKSPFGDYKADGPGTIHRIAPADLPPPYATDSVRNSPKIVPRPQGAMPQTMPGYSVSVYADGLENPRLLQTAPNGDIFIAESRTGNIKVLRGRGRAGRVQTIDTFATGLNRPFGIGFYPSGASPEYVYIANTNSVVRFPYRSGDLKARGPQEVVVKELPTGGGHWTRGLAFSRDGKKMFVSIGSQSNVDDEEKNPAEQERARVIEFNPDGSGRRVYATGIRNPVGLAVHPRTGQVWVSVNERDALGDDLVPDYITHVEDGGFYGWPWYYIGGNQDPRHEGKRPELKAAVKVPDVLIQPHSASLQLTFYTGTQFPAEHRDSIFAAEHGSWNRSMRTGYKVIRVPLRGGAATGEYQDFLTGFVVSDGEVWGRPVGVTVASDGALLVSDDASNTIWRVSYGKK
jgi:glucose/arabinose dehydrogenase